MASWLRLNALFTGVFITICLTLSPVDAKKPKAEEVKKTDPVVPGLSQEEVGRRAIRAILEGQPIDSLRQFFEDSVIAQMTQENVDAFRGQISWLPRFIGDSVEVFMTGTQVLDSTGRTAFYREYRFANEMAKRAPLMLVHFYFQDSVSPKIAGGYNKTFDDDTRNRIADAQTWTTTAGVIDIHSVSYVELEGNILPIVRMYDVDTAKLDSTRALSVASAVAKEAVARGYLKIVQDAKPNLKLMERFGVSFIRREPAHGYQQVPIVIAAKAYMPEADTTKASQAKSKSGKATAKPQPKKAPVKKK